MVYWNAYVVINFTCFNEQCTYKM